jgi:hypothetical protein
MALVALAVQGAGMASQTAWAVLPVALAGYAIGGLGHGVKNTLLRTLIARRVPEQVHGRAFAAYNAARNAAEVLALGAGGLLVAAIGPRPCAAARRPRPGARRSGGSARSPPPSRPGLRSCRFGSGGAGRLTQSRP